LKCQKKGGRKKSLGRRKRVDLTAPLKTNLLDRKREGIHSAQRKNELLVVGKLPCPRAKKKPLRRVSQKGDRKPSGQINIGQREVGKNVEVWKKGKKTIGGGGGGKKN